MVAEADGDRRLEGDRTMQVTEISAQGLKREYKVVLPAADLASRLDGELAEMKDKVQINGFRPGKVPTVAPEAPLRPLRSWATSCRTPSTRPTARSSRTTACASRWSRRSTCRATRPKSKRRMEAKGDLAFTVALETLPNFEAGTFDDHRARAAGRRASTTRRSTRRSSRMAEQNRTYTPEEGDDAAADEATR